MDAHHKKNRHPKAPKPEILTAIHDMDVASDNDDTVSEVEESFPEAGESDDNGPHRAARHSRTPYGSNLPNFTQLHRYPGTWRDLLEDGKQCNRYGASINRTFTSRNIGLKDAKDSLLETMADYEKKGIAIEKGMCSILIYILDTIPTTPRQAITQSIKRRWLFW